MKHQEELLLDDYYTIGICFDPVAEDSKKYTYKVHEDMAVAVGDLVVVQVGAVFKVVEVAEVHEESAIDYSTNFEYKYIVDLVDLTRYTKLKERSKEIAKVLTESRRASLKKELLCNVTDTLDESVVKKLNAACGNDFI